MSLLCIKIYVHKHQQEKFYNIILTRNTLDFIVIKVNRCQQIIIISIQKIFASPSVYRNIK